MTTKKQLAPKKKKAVRARRPVITRVQVRKAYYEALNVPDPGDERGSKGKDSLVPALLNEIVGAGHPDVKSDDRLEVLHRLRNLRVDLNKIIIILIERTAGR